MRKYQVVNLLAATNDFHALLEISTPTTGQTFHEAMEGRNFRRVERIVYRCAPEQDDGLPHTFRTAETSSERLVRQRLIQCPEGYDIVFVDPFHSWSCSMTDLLGAWLLLRPGGALVVHDCNPASAELASPEFCLGGWCGVTYQAYVDFLLSIRPPDHFTVDSDYGVGVAFKPLRGHVHRMDSAPPQELAETWARVRADDEARYRFFDAHRAELLNLVSEDWLVERYAAPLLWASSASGLGI